MPRAVHADLRREKAAAAGLKPPMLHAAGFPGDDRADRRGIALGSDELQTNPVVAIPAFVLQEHWSAAHRHRLSPILFACVQTWKKPLLFSQDAPF